MTRGPRPPTLPHLTVQLDGDEVRRAIAAQCARLLEPTHAIRWTPDLAPCVECGQPAPTLTIATRGYGTITAATCPAHLEAPPPSWWGAP
jgi:hypothetical protein